MAGRDVAAFVDAGRTLYSLGLVKGSEGNLSTFDLLYADRILFTSEGLDALTGERTEYVVAPEETEAEAGNEKDEADAVLSTEEAE